MGTERSQHGKALGLTVIVAAAAAGLAIIGAAAVIAGKPPPREDYLPRAPKDKEQAPPPVAGEDDADAIGTEPRPEELVARAKKLIAEGSPNRAQIEGLLLAAIKARPGDDGSIEAFRLLRSLHAKWRGEGPGRPAPGERTGPASPPPPRAVEPPPASERAELYREDFERGPGRWSGKTVRDAETGGSVLQLRHVPEDKYSLLKSLIQGLRLQGNPDTRVSFRYRTEGSLSRLEVQFWLQDATGKGNNHHALLSPSRNWTSTELEFGRLSAKGDPIDRARGFTVVNMQVFAGLREEQGACFIDDVSIYEPAGAAAVAPPAAPRLPVAPPAPATPGFVDLVGTDLSNWGRPSGGTWKVEKGGILAESMNLSGYLCTRKRFRDFTLKLKVMPLATNTTSPHLRIRFRWVPEKGKYGCQTDLARKAYFIAELKEDKSDEQVFDVPPEASLRIGTRAEIEIVVIGENVTVLVGGKQAFSATAKVTEPGQVALCAHRSSLFFERVEIKEH